MIPTQHWYIPILVNFESIPNPIYGVTQLEVLFHFGTNIKTTPKVQRLMKIHLKSKPMILTFERIWENNYFMCSMGSFKVLALF
jgi:hypothetical protein